MVSSTGKALGDTQGPRCPIQVLGPPTIGHKPYDLTEVHGLSVEIMVTEGGLR